MKVTRLIVVLLVVLVIGGFVLVQADNELPPQAYLPVMMMDVVKPTPQPTSTPTNMPTPTPPPRPDVLMERPLCD